ncbi:alpha/beta hydrolase-fold protein [Tautonia plasticadhaerens]|uniref:Esterase n=1 Tax=Tautonia plasticadhaerens TaxID=2527974 RepID=A0A518GW54_9BACT|nr:alpha/beta hydrolase-fold protein [Tautonia plasticadhaerens]QDV32818.1 hypothetical protein ElP_06580 [Tautonia plasticadhaerens]
MRAIPRLAPPFVLLALPVLARAFGPAEPPTPRAEPLEPIPSTTSASMPVDAHSAVPALSRRFDVTVAEGLVDEPTDGRLLVILSRRSRPEPRDAIGLPLPGSPAVLGVDAMGIAPGQVVAVDASAEGFPASGLDRLPPGDYFVQAVLMRNPDLLLIDAPGNLSSEPVPVRLDPEADGSIGLELSRIEPPEQLPGDTDLVRYVKFPSKLLSEFHGRPISLRAAVVLPRDFDREADRRYPLRVHIGGFGSRYTAARRRMAEGSSFRQMWLADDTPRFLMLFLDGAGPLGDPYQVNSANHGPYGDAITRELIPYVEEAFRGIGEGHARVLDGGSTGGWVSIALQVFYPDFFNGCWSSCPDSVDFRSFQLVNIYEDPNAYTSPDGTPRTAFRREDGTPVYAMREECQLENALGLGDSWTMSGGQWGSWNATYGPKGADGRPVPLWDPDTGAIDRSVLDHWARYDLRRILEADWATLGPKLRGKLHIWVGEADNFFLEDAVHRLDAFLRAADPPFEGTIAYGDGEGHCWSGITEAEMMRQMAGAVASGAS